MPLQIKFNKQKFEVADNLSTMEELLTALSQTELLQICPLQFQFSYKDQDGDKISVMNTEDFLSFMEDRKNSKKAKTLNLKAVGKKSLDSLSLPIMKKSLDQLVQEQMEKQLSLSVTKFKNEMQQTVRTLVEEQTKEYLSQSQIQQKKVKVIGNTDIPTIADVVSTQLASLQEIQDELLNIKDNTKTKQLTEQFKETLDQLKDTIKDHLKEIKTQVKTNQEKRKLDKSGKIGKGAENKKVQVQPEVNFEDTAIFKYHKKKYPKEKTLNEKKLQIVELTNDVPLIIEKEVPQVKEEKLPTVKEEQVPKQNSMESANQRHQETYQEIFWNPNNTYDMPEVQKQTKSIPEIQTLIQPSIQQKKKVTISPKCDTVQESCGLTVDQANVNRAQSLSKICGFDQSVILALIRKGPKQTDDQIMNQLLDQFM